MTNCYLKKKKFSANTLYLIFFNYSVENRIVYLMMFTLFELNIGFFWFSQLFFHDFNEMFLPETNCQWSLLFHFFYSILPVRDVSCDGMYSRESSRSILPSIMMLKSSWSKYLRFYLTGAGLLPLNCPARTAISNMTALWPLCVYSSLTSHDLIRGNRLSLTNVSQRWG